MTILTKVNHENQAQIVRCKLISVALLSIISPSAYADELKVSPFLSASLTYDDNVYLLADEEDEIQIIGQDQRSDTIINAGIGVNGKYDSRSSNIKFGARVFRRDHTDFEVLDFTGGDASVKGNWKLGKRWETELGYRFERDQSNFSEENLAQGDVFDSHRVNAGLTLHVGEKRDLYINASFKDKDYEQRFALANERTDISLGYRQFSRRDNWVALEVAHADGDYPNRLDFSGQNLEENISLQSYTEDSLKLLSKWRLGKKTKIEAHIGYIDRQHNDVLENFDYDGVIFDFDLEWNIGSKTQFTANVSQRLRDTENTNTLFTKEQRLSMGFEWTSSEKLMFNTALTFLDLEFIQQGENREDTGSILEVGAKYAINKRSSVEPKVRIRTRSSNNLNNEYDNSIATINYHYML